MSKIALVVTVKVKPEYTEKLKPAMLENAKQSAQEEACYQFDVIVSQDDENTFMFYEVYKDEQALADHRQTLKRYQSLEHVSDAANAISFA